MSTPNSTSKHRSFRLSGSSNSLDIESVGSLREAFWFAVVQQVFIYVLSALMLDFGVLNRRVLVAMIAFWCFVAMFLVRRRKKPTAVDILFIKYGIWFLIAAVGILAPLLGRF